MATSINFFDALGIAEDATAPQIRAAYLARITALHPDVTSDPEHHRQASEVNAAYSLLRDDRQRARYRTEVRMSRFRAEWRARETTLRLGDGPILAPLRRGPDMRLMVLGLALVCGLVSAPLAGSLFGVDRAQAQPEPTKPCSYATAFTVRSCLTAVKDQAPGQGDIPSELAGDNAQR